MKDDIRSLGLATEDAVRHGNMVVDVEVKAAAEALGKAYSAAADGRRARGLCLSPGHERRPKLFALPTPDFSHEDSTDGAQRSGVAGQEQAQFKGNAQHPLADGNVWEDSVCEMCGRAAHAARVARRADATALTREGHDEVASARLAPRMHEAMRGDSAVEVGRSPCST